MRRSCRAVAMLACTLVASCASGSSIGHRVVDDRLAALGKVRPLLVADPELIAITQGTWKADWTIHVTNMGLAVPISEVRTGYWTDLNGNGDVDDGEINPADPRSGVISVTAQDCTAGARLGFNETCSIQLHLLQSGLHHAVGVYSNGILMLTIKVVTT